MSYAEVCPLCHHNLLNNKCINIQCYNFTTDCFQSSSSSSNTSRINVTNLVNQVNNTSNSSEFSIDSLLAHKSSSSAHTRSQGPSTITWSKRLGSELEENPPLNQFYSQQNNLTSRYQSKIKICKPKNKQPRHLMTSNQRKIAQQRDKKQKKKHSKIMDKDDARNMDKHFDFTVPTEEILNNCKRGVYDSLGMNALVQVTCAVCDLYHTKTQSHVVNVDQPLLDVSENKYLAF
jgi:hypothetical protein